MGLDAHVSCRCWQDGLTTTPPPAPVEFDEGFVCSVDCKDWELVLDWTETAGTCPHHGMDYRHESIGNWGAVRDIEKLLIRVGRSMFPTLLSTMASILNGGTVEVDDCKRCIAELDLLESGVIGMTRWDIVDQLNGDIVSWADEVDIWGSGWYGHCVGGGFYLSELDGPIQLRNAGPIELEAFEFTQIPTGHVDTLGRPIYIVRSVDSSPEVARAWTSYPCKAWNSEAVPEHLKIQRSWMPAREHRDWTRAALRNIFTAAVEVGNPVAWT